jgi:hypothetical protein
MDTYNPSELTAAPKKVDISLRQLADFDSTGGDRNRVDNVRDNQILVSLSKFNRPKTFSFHYISDILLGGNGVTISTDKDGITSITNTGVTKIIAGTNISISPVTGIGNVTIAAASGGITSLNALTAAVQTFINDTNVSIVSSGTTHTLTWLGTLADARITSAATWNAKQNELFDFSTKQGIFIFDDMWYGQSSVSFINNNLLWAFSGGSQIVQSNAFFGLVPTTTQRGVTLFKTQTSAVSFVNFVIGNYSSVLNNTIFYLANGKINYETYVLFPILSTAAERFYFHFGFTSNSTSLNPIEYVGIVYNEGTTFGYDNNLGGSPNFTFNNGSGASKTRTINSSAVAINTWYKLRIEVLCDTSVINFYVNNVLVATHTTNIPAAATRVQPFMNFTKTIGITNREVAVDYVAIKQDFTTLR